MAAQKTITAAFIIIIILSGNRFAEAKQDAAQSAPLPTDSETTATSLPISDTPNATTKKIPVPAQDWVTYHTGARVPTTAEKNRFLKKSLKAKKIRFNALGKERINKELRRKNLPELPADMPAATIGDEIISEQGDTSPSLLYSGEMPTTYTAAEIPTAVNNSTLPYFPPIGNQETQNSCAQFSAIYYSLTHMTAMARNLNAKANVQYRLSPKFTYNFLNMGSGETGSWEGGGWEIAIKHGVPSLQSWPYDGNPTDWPLSASIWKEAINNRAAQQGYVPVNSSAEQDLSALKQLLTNGYVLTFTTEMWGWHLKTIANDPSIAEDDPYAGELIGYKVAGEGGLHSMTIVGYNDTLWADVNANNQIDSGEKGAFLIANSWGADWANQGFIWLAYDAINGTTTVPGATQDQDRRPALSGNQANFVIARSSYSPAILAQFTLNSASRYQLYYRLGISPVTENTFSLFWDPAYPLNNGAMYADDIAFDGGTTAVDCTFVFDFSDIAPTTNTTSKWYLQMTDFQSSYATTLKSFSLIDLRNQTHVDLGGTPISFNAETIAPVITYTTNQNTTPLPPENVSLTADSTSQVTAQWDASGTADGYRIDVSTSSAFSSFVSGYNNLNIGAVTSKTIAGLQTNVTYYLRVRSYNSYGTSSNSTSACAVPLAIASLTAPNGSITTTLPTFSWSAISGATRYELWVDNASDAISQIIGKNDLTGTSFSVTTSILQYGKNYRWWVRGGNSTAWGPWSQGADFTCTQTPPPTLIAPQGAISTVTPKFTWSSVSGATRYELWVDNATDGMSHIIGQSNLTGTSYTVPTGFLQYGKTYRWWVRSGNATSWGPWSPEASFSTSMPAPTLSAPKGTITKTTPTFYWSSVSGATRYELWVDNTTDGSSKVIWKNNLTGTSYAVTTSTLLTSGKTYTWWVRAGDASSWGPWSSPSSFTVSVSTTPPAAPSLISPNGTIYTTRPVFSWSAVSGATQYEIWVDNVTDGISKAFWMQGMSSNSLSSPVTFTKGKTYRWWVRAANGSTWGAWSNGAVFIIQ